MTGSVNFRDERKSLQYSTVYETVVKNVMIEGKPINEDFKSQYLYCSTALTFQFTLTFNVLDLESIFFKHKIVNLAESFDKKKKKKILGRNRRILFVLVVGNDKRIL